MAEVIMPKMGDAMTEGTLLSWRKSDGEAVKMGDVIAEIETDKSNVEVEAEEAGVLHIKAKVGDAVPVGETIATIENGVSATRASGSPEKTAARPSDNNGSNGLRPEMTVYSAEGL